MSEIKALGYLGFSVSDTEKWREYAQNVLGVNLIENECGDLLLRIDSYAWRIKLTKSGHDQLDFIGWEVSDKYALEQLKLRLTHENITYTEGSDELAKSRQVKELVVFNDPDGTRCEAFYGPLQLTNIPFVSPKGFKFITGEQGLGHIVLITKDHVAQEAFYTHKLGFKVSDYISTEVVPGKPLNITFLRCNGRHHSLALAPVPISSKVAHIMLQVDSIDDVGRAMESAENSNCHFSFTLGRHSNDEMLSFYTMSPSGFDVEFGWGAIEIDDDNWHVKVHHTNSAWGHKFQRPPRNK
jgi:biphenyl-2,3-diol 1,2-dioxygenase/3,4-dihydroxy-9,10-secoandrosta-1,3,5(10)-triene-9,17-dione 4,5-dioxygenase